MRTVPISFFDGIFSGACDFKDIFMERRSIARVFLTLSKIKIKETGTSAGVGLRTVKGDFTDLRSGDFTDDAEEYLLKQGISLKCRAPLIKFNFEKFFIFLKEMDTSLREKGGGQVKNIDISFSVSDSSAGVYDWQKVLVKNSYRQKFIIMIMVEDGHGREISHEHVLATEPSETEFMDACRKKSFETLSLALNLLKASPAPAGEMPVLIKSSAGGTLIHEAIGHSLEADAVRLGISPVYAGRLGKKVAASEVTVIDDATVRSKNGSYEYDDEGVRSERVVLIENGILKNYLLDRKEAGFLKTVSNGHGRRASYGEKPIPRMGVTYLSGGKSDYEMMLGKMKKGLLVSKMGGGQVNPANGDFVFEVREGYLVENGKVGPLVKGATIAGNGPKILENIKYIGKTVGWDDGFCGKDGQAVPVSDGMPDTLIPAVVVGGRGG